MLGLLNIFNYRFCFEEPRKQDGNAPCSSSISLELKPPVNLERTVPWKNQYQRLVLPSNDPFRWRVMKMSILPLITKGDALRGSICPWFGRTCIVPMIVKHGE
jgi:hypothetical protein